MARIPSPILAVAALVTSFALAGTSAVFASGSVSGAASGTITAHLTKTSFAAVQAGSVSLVYTFSPASTRFGYLLSLKKGTNWVTVRSVNKTGSFKGTYTMTVKQLFGSHALKIGQYRVRVSADGGSKLLSFKVVTDLPPGAFNKTRPIYGAYEQLPTATLSWGSSSSAASYEYCVDTSNNNTCAGSWVSVGASSASPSGLAPNTTYYWQVRAENALGEAYSDGGTWWHFTTWKPKTGSWTTSSGVSFSVISGVVVDRFNAAFSGYGRTFLIYNTPIVADQFARTGPYYYSGTFDSPTTAHGTVGLNNYCPDYDGPCYTGEPYTWVATWSSP